MFDQDLIFGAIMIDFSADWAIFFLLPILYFLFSSPSTVSAVFPFSKMGERASIRSHMITMSRYNLWANEKLITLLQDHVPDDEFDKNTGVVFRSIHGTLAHIYLAETIWYSFIPPVYCCTWLLLLQHLSAAASSSSIFQFLNSIQFSRFNRFIGVDSTNLNEYWQAKDSYSTPDATSNPWESVEPDRKELEEKLLERVRPHTPLIVL